MVKLKPTPSKRQSTKQRVKISKRVAEHHRKLRRDAKRNPQWKSRHEKDPGIPNSFPFKEQMLEEIRQKRIAADEAKLVAKEQLRQERAQRKAAGTTAEHTDSEEEEEGDPEEGFFTAAQSLLVQSPVYRDSLDQLMDDNSFHSILVALDARDPLSWALPTVQTTTQSHSKNFAYVLTRTDLVPREVVNAWTSVLEKQFTAPVFPVSLRPDEEPLGLERLLDQLRTWAPSKETPTRVVVCGLEHAGRTSIATNLHRLAQQSTEEETNVSSSVQVYDSAHLISVQDPGKEDQASFLSQLIRNKGPMQKSKETEALARALISRVAKVIDLQLLYTLPAFAAGAESRSGAELTATELDEFIVHLGRALGLLNKRGIPAVQNVLRKLVFDWSHGGMMYYATPPLSRAEVTQQMEAAGSEVPTTKAGLDEVVLPLTQWRKKFSRYQVRLLPGPVDPRTYEWDYLFFVPPTERSTGTKGKKAVQFADDGSEPEAELTEDDDEEEDEDEDLSSDDLDDEVPSDEDSDQESEDASEEVQEEEPKSAAPNSVTMKKATKNQHVPSKSTNKRKADPQNSSEQPSKKSSVKPGEKYDFFAHF